MVAAETEYAGPGQGDDPSEWGDHNPLQCEICGRTCQTRAALLSHARTHARGREQGEERQTTRPGKASQRKPRQPKGLNEVQTGLLLTYSLAGQAFAMFGPAPEQARQAVGMTMQITSMQAAFGLERLARRTPVYKALRVVFGAAGALNDLAPVAMPLMVGMYGYAPAPVQARMAPMFRTMLGQVILQTFGPEPPASPEEIVPTALPEWIRQLTEGLIPSPQDEPQTVRAAAA